jgi:hypothetical protein
VSPQALDPEAIFREAAQTGQLYPTKASFRNALIVAGLVCCALVVTIPLGIWLIVAARRSSVALGSEGFAIKRFLTRAYRWTDLESLRTERLESVASGQLVGDLIGAAVISAVEAGTAGLKGPIRFRLKGQRGERVIAAQTLENSARMAEELERRSGLKLAK